MSDTGVIVVTGISSGVGQELARQLLREGHQIVGLGRREPEDAELAAAQAQGRLRLYRADLADAAGLDVALAALVQAEPRVDALVNNAGVGLEALQYSPQGREMHFEVNTRAPHAILTALLPRLRAGRWRRVVNVSSDAALMVRGYEPQRLVRPQRFRKLLGPYAHSKLALSLWTQALAPRLAAEGVHVISANPGGNRTAMTQSAGMPAWLRPLVRFSFVFRHPSHGAGLLQQALFGDHPAGAFVNKRRTVALPFAERAAETLALVEGLASS